MYRCVIIDSDTNSNSILKDCFGQIENFTLVDIFTDPSKASDYLNSVDDIDLLLIDIVLPEVNGVQFIQKIRNCVNKVIIITNSAAFAYDGFEVQADAFLLKPLEISNLFQTINRLFPVKKKMLTSKYRDNYFFIKHRGGGHLAYIKLNFDEVISIESKLNYVQFHTYTESLKMYSSLADIVKELNFELGFLQINRSYIVNKKHISSIVGSIVMLSNGAKISIGDKYRCNINAFISEALLNCESR